MMMIQAWWALLRKEALLELRLKYALGGILLYVTSTVFTGYLALGQQVGGAVWAAFYWVLVLFASVNAVAKSFVLEPAGRQLYYYTLAPPAAVLLAKITYNWVLLLLISVLALLTMGVVLGLPVRRWDLFASVLLLGSSGLAIALTFISAIAAKAHNSATLMAVLSFPVVVPLLLLLLRLTKQALLLMQDTASWRDVVMLLSVDTILLTISVWLFPFLWRE